MTRAADIAELVYSWTGSCMKSTEPLEKSRNIDLTVICPLGPRLARA